MKFSGLALRDCDHFEARSPLIYYQKNKFLGRLYTMSFLWTGRSARHFRKGNRQKSKPKRYRGDLFHPVSYLQAPEEVMISPFRTKRKIRYPPSLRSSKLDLMDMILDRKYRHIIDAAKSHLLARGGDRYA